ncbi:hypothetical protein SAMN04490357_7579 [Streptomyces misionensis]|uniref:Uncharacterized protein n=1 Tax=Streptomyces misionensis TaxID=67331 RepID=A0A1H5HQ11_9ACTN|nr:acyl-CoA dehydrogenase family protein [Streptomyces misionensis]SEE29874.1 hypothetical protein SAMN04490357_7579 [Streptomyces misionensis]
MRSRPCTEDHELFRDTVRELVDAFLIGGRHPS